MNCSESPSARRLSVGLLSSCLLALWGTDAFAGMPAPLPLAPERTLRLGETPLLRLQSISFFVVVFLVCAAVVQFLWNALRRDLPGLPRLSYGRAVAAVLLWGLLFLVVLTMISGARELMTPGAWQKQGLTYKLSDDTAQPAPGVSASERERREHLERLRTVLVLFAATHQGRFPSPAEVTAVPAELWAVPGAGGVRYIYTADRRAGPGAEVLVCEPEMGTEVRFVLMTNGDVMTVRPSEPRLPAAQEKVP